MARTVIGFAFLLFVVAGAARAQVPVLTNADLGKPVTQKITLTPAQWQNFVDHQTKIILPARWNDYGGGRVAVSGWTMPTAEALRRPTYPLQPPFFMSTYVGPTIGVIRLGPDGHSPRR
jgi:hypothetical protein